MVHERAPLREQHLGRDRGRAGGQDDLGTVHLRRAPVASLRAGVRTWCARPSRARRLSVSSCVSPPVFGGVRAVMATLRFLLKRFFAQRLLGLAIVVTLGFTIGVLVAGPIYADAAREAILSSAVSTAPGHGEERPVPHLRQPRRTTTRPRTRPSRTRSPGSRSARSCRRAAGPFGWSGPIRTPRSRSRCCSATAPPTTCRTGASLPRGPARSRSPAGSRGCSASTSARP